MHAQPDNFILRGNRCYLKTGKIEIDITQVANFLMHSQRRQTWEEAVEILMSVEMIIPSKEPPKNQLSQNQIYGTGQMNMKIRIKDKFDFILRSFNSNNYKKQLLPKITFNEHERKHGIKK